VSHDSTLALFGLEMGVLISGLEALTENQGVGGSSPPLGTNRIRYCECAFPTSNGMLDPFQSTSAVKSRGQEMSLDGFAWRLHRMREAYPGQVLSGFLYPDDLEVVLPISAELMEDPTAGKTFGSALIEMVQRHATEARETHLKGK
jgi:hypothetical protein